MVNPNQVLWRPEQYAGERAIRVQATQLEDRGVSGSAKRRRILREWIEFLSNVGTNVVDLEFVSRTPQELLDAATGQRQLRSIHVKWGPYNDLSWLARLPQPQSLHLGGATSVDTLRPLARLRTLTSLSVSQAYEVDDVTELSALVRLRGLTYGNASLSSDRNVTVADLEWLRSFGELRALHLPGTRLVRADLSPILDLPNLEELNIPLRRSYRRQVLEYAPASRAFAAVAAEYAALENWRASNRHH